MGRIRASHDHTEHTLEPRTLVGRSPACGLRLVDAKVSGEHASIMWTASTWQIRDLASSNGTFIAGARLAPGDSAVIDVGSRIAFGSDGMVFECIDASPPAPVAIAPDGRQVRGGNALLFLPDADQPRACVYWKADAWWVDVDGSVSAAGETLLLDDHRWTLRLPHVLGATVVRRNTIAHVTLALHVSRDEEFVRTAVTVGGAQHTLTYRAHHYLLVVLARHRLEDGAGWIDAEQLARMMGLSRQAMNLQVFRIRKDFETLGIEDAADVIERRAGGQLRLTIANTTVSALPD